VRVQSLEGRGQKNPQLETLPLQPETRNLKPETLIFSSTRNLKPKPETLLFNFPTSPL
jgi:hypothetical protein